MVARNYSNTAVETTLVGSINNVVASMVVGSVSGFPTSYPYSLAINSGEVSEEIVTVTNAVSTTLTIVRGEDGTAAASHISGAPVIHVITARDVSEPQVHMEASTNVHGLSGGAAVVGTSQSQTLTNKTISGATNTLTNLPAANVTGTFSSLTTSGNVTAVDGIFSDDITVDAITTTGSVSVGGNLTVTGTGPYFENVQVDTYVANDTWTKPTGAKWVQALVQGAGGGGGGVAATGVNESAWAAGGGGGGYGERWFDASALGATETVTVGVGGVGAAAGNNPGGTGGSSVFDAVTALGGAGGAGMLNGASTVFAAGGDAGGQVGGDFGAFGGDGLNSIRFSAFAGVQGPGGTSRFAGNLRGPTSATGAAGESSAAPGGGGSGAHNFASQVARAGGAGGDGLVVVITYL